MTLLKLQEATCGKILLGETDLAEIESSSWWKQISWLPQNPTILPGTILENVLNGKEVDETTLLQAAKLTGLEQIIQNQPQGWETKLGDGGVGLSVGQRQRLALTRTLLFPPKLLVMDEPTAHLDAISEEQVTGIIETLRQAKVTVLVIAHRQAVLKVADQIISVTSGAASDEDLAKYPQLHEQEVLESLEVSSPGLLSEKEEAK